jgi:GNAT superfamily N-acetyltransferase
MRVFRKLPPSDGAAYRDHLLRLDADDRRLRFAGGLAEAAVRAHCARVDWFSSVLLGCFEDGVLRGVAELRFAAPPAREAELALSVERGWQGRGIGGELLARIRVVAGNRGVRRLTMLCLAENRRVLRLAGRFGAAFTTAAGQVEAAIAAPPPTPASLMAEAASDGFELVAAWWEAALPRAA